MSITQTVEIPASHRLTIDVPREVPTGAVILTFTPKTADDDWFSQGGECPICAAHRDPATGNPRYNAETIAGMQEVEDMIAGKIPVNWHHSLEDLDKMLGL
jgi:hypothetical protein